MICNDYKQQHDDIENQLELLCKDRGITRKQLYDYNGFSEGEKFVIMRLLETRAKIVREELLYMHNKYNNVVYLSAFRGKKKT